uniref:Putative amino acid transporter n=1 Tax=Rhipicephalus microplus TaxID=6941 RepID=A0A6M2D843_RHIMP
MVDFVALILPVPVPSGHLYCGFVVGCGVLFVLSSGTTATYCRYWCGVVNTPVAVVLTILLLTGIAGNNKMATGTGEAMFTIKLFDLGSLIGDVSGLSKGVKDVTSALYFVSLGILAFNFAGVCEFTNIRRDMKAPPSFTKAAAFGVAGSTLALFIVGVTACAVLYPFNGNVVLIFNTRNVRIAAHFFTVTCFDQLTNLSDLILGEYDRVEDYGKRP